MGKVAALLLSCFFSLLLAEGGVRIFRSKLVFWNEFPVDFKQVYDVHTGWLLEPNVEFPYRSPSGKVNTIRANKLGFRTPYNPGDNTEVLIIGDSFGAGIEVAEHETFPAVAEAQLRKLLKRDIRVVNGSLSGAYPAQYYLSYRYYLHRYKPKIVVVGLYLGNDLIEDPLPLFPKSNLPHAKDQGVHRIKNWLLDHSYLTNLALASILRYKSSGSFGLLTGKEISLPRSVPTEEAVPSHLKRTIDFLTKTRGKKVPPSALVNGIVPQFKQEIRYLGPYDENGKPKNQLARKGIETALQRLSNLKEEIEKDGARMFVVFIPSRLMVDPIAATEVSFMIEEKLIEKRPEIKGSEFSQNLKRIFESAGFQVLDLCAKMSESAINTHIIYWPVDGHFNERGYRIVGEMVAEAIYSEGIFD